MMNATSEIPDSGADPMKQYDPNLPVPYWHQRMELAGVIIVNSLSLIAIIARLYLRAFRLKRFRADDKWMVAAGAFLIFPHFVCQIGTNRYGSGLHDQNIPDEWVLPFWYFSWGWIGYNIVSSLIKISVCCYLLQIVPFHMLILRRLIYVLMCITFSLGLGISLCHLLQCTPVISNFDYTVKQQTCFNIDIPRFTWIAVSISIDICILAIPWAIIRGSKIQPSERRILLIVFSGNLLGTIVCIVSIYSVWSTRTSLAYYDLAYTQTAFAITNDVEILFYALGASLPVLSPFLLSRFATKQEGHHTTTSRVPSWRVKGGSTIGSPIQPRMSQPKRSKSYLTTFNDADFDDENMNNNTIHGHHHRNPDEDDETSSDTTLANRPSKSSSGDTMTEGGHMKERVEDMV
ncbi:hypothetical protein H072_3294 [Dactylellina haptotyla CBS 200.50]|uniref:Rhodopsin domain-containing protein n=1 Tax=Dactylellina haptotyla (strain CBS 200.50) TaxID=1284197 RepID=S8ANJ7_DACHA|nr:hypothetical protein H072_3294 [Dactylellina haptotyla CBS 200.50]